MIKNTKQDTLMFRLNFSTLFINTFVESTLSGTNQINVVNKLVLVKDFSKIDWCKYILDCLVSRKQLWRRDDNICYYSGPILVLTLVYMYRIKFTGLKIVKRLPFVRNVTDEMLDGMMRDYCAEEVFVAVIEHSYGVILSEKKNIEKALKHGIEKFPDNLMLKEWCEKNKELFKEVNNAETGGMKYNEASFDDHSNKGEADGGKVEGFSPVRGLVVHGEKKDDGGGLVHLIWIR
ncbi:unnamed protein product [Lactuca saligna]|uniref:Uncharacterized protein n=1 Tax=Lactuca saligna TaxID=75948 RepID=A0AA35Z7P3_LACSI|nr:unnamed protein product [Lactuca saligna]